MRKDLHIINSIEEKELPTAFNIQLIARFVKNN